MAESRVVQEIPLGARDRRRLAVLMAQPDTTSRDERVERILAKYVGFAVELTPVPEGHTHDGKKHEGLEVHFRRRREGFEVEDYEGDFCYREPPGCAYVSVAEELVGAA